MSNLKIPKDALTSLKKPNKLLILSLLTVIVANCMTIFGFNTLDLKIKIIICLSIFSFVLLIDVIVLYSQYYMYYYQTEYLNKIYNLVDINVDNIEKSIIKLQKESSEIRNSIKQNDNDIEFLKSKFP